VFLKPNGGCIKGIFRFQDAIKTGKCTKAKLFLCLIEQNAMKTYGAVEIKLYGYFRL
jgi:hypothetical protein